MNKHGIPVRQKKHLFMPARKLMNLQYPILNSNPVKKNMLHSPKSFNSLYRLSWIFNGPYGPLKHGLNLPIICVPRDWWLPLLEPDASEPGEIPMINLGPTWWNLIDNDKYIYIWKTQKNPRTRIQHLKKKGWFRVSDLFLRIAKKNWILKSWIAIIHSLSYMEVEKENSVSLLGLIKASLAAGQPASYLPSQGSLSLSMGNQ